MQNIIDIKEIISKRNSAYFAKKFNAESRFKWEQYKCDFKSIVIDINFCRVNLDYLILDTLNLGINDGEYSFNYPDLHKEYQEIINVENCWATIDSVAKACQELGTLKKLKYIYVFEIGYAKGRIEVLFNTKNHY